MTQCECQGGRRLSCITKVLLESDIKVNWCMNQEWVGIALESLIRSTAPIFVEKELSFVMFD